MRKVVLVVAVACVGFLAGFMYRKAGEVSVERMLETVRASCVSSRATGEAESVAAMCNCISDKIEEKVSDDDVRRWFALNDDGKISRITKQAEYDCLTEMLARIRGE